MDLLGSISLKILISKNYHMQILKIEDYNYSIVYIENNDKSSVYKRFSDGKWMQLNSNRWSIVKNVSELEKVFKQKKDDSLIK